MLLGNIMHYDFHMLLPLSFKQGSTRRFTVALTSIHEVIDWLLIFILNFTGTTPQNQIKSFNTDTTMDTSCHVWIIKIMCIMFMLSQCTQSAYRKLPIQNTRVSWSDLSENMKAFDGFKSGKNKQLYPDRTTIWKQMSANNESQCDFPSFNNTDKTAGMGNCQQNSLYSLTLGIGTPPQNFVLQFDTGSDILWLTTVQAGNPEGFNPNLSSTCKINTKDPQNVTYVNGAGVFGFHGTDSVNLAYTQITNVSCPILFANEIKGLSFPSQVLGLVGMGFTNPQTLPNFLDLSYQKGIISSNTFSLELKNYLLYPLEESYLYFDQIPDSIISQTVFSPVYLQSAGYWQTELIGVYADKNDYTSYAARAAVIDSGTSLFYLNPQLQQAFVNDYLPSSKCNFTDGLNTCNCTILPSLPTLQFIFPQVAVYLHPEDYVQTYDGQICYVHIYVVNDEENPEILLGDTLFMNYVITFDKENKNIGFKGQIQIITVFGEQDFILSQYIMLGFDFVLFLIGVWLIFFVRVLKKQNQQISLANFNIFNKKNRNQGLRIRQATQMSQTGKTIIKQGFIQQNVVHDD